MPTVVEIDRQRLDPVFIQPQYDPRGLHAAFRISLAFELCIDRARLEAAVFDDDIAVTGDRYRAGEAAGAGEERARLRRCKLRERCIKRIGETPAIVHGLDLGFAVCQREVAGPGDDVRIPVVKRTIAVDIDRHGRQAFDAESPDDQAARRFACLQGRRQAAIGRPEEEAAVQSVPPASSRSISSVLSIPRCEIGQAQVSARGQRCRCTYDRFGDVYPGYIERADIHGDADAGAVFGRFVVAFRVREGVLVLSEPRSAFSTAKVPLNSAVGNQFEGYVAWL